MRISDWSSDVCSSDLARGIEAGDHRVRQIGGAQQGRRYIDRDPHVAGPLRGGIAGLRKHPFADRSDHRNTFRDGNELTGRYIAQHRMPPTDQRFATGDLTGFQVEYRLVDHAEFTAFYAPAKASLL